MVVVGRKGSGKSTLVRKVADLYPRVFVIDTMAEYGDRRRSSWHIANGFKACVEVIRDAHEQKRFRIALRTDTTNEALDLMALIYTVPDSMLIVEETAFYCSPSHLPDEMQALVRLGRHQRISQVYVTQRPAAIHRDLTAAADLVVAFRTHENRDVKYFRDLVDDGERVKELPLYKVWVYGDIDRAPMPVLEAMHEPFDRSSRDA
jgi:hypothetical protein